MGTPNSERLKFTKLNPDTVKKLEEVAALDGSVEEMCFYADISRQTYYNWMKANPNMQERFDNLRQRPFLKARQTIVKNLDNPQHAFEYMRRKKKAEFSDRSEVEIGASESIIDILNRLNKR